MRTSMALAAVSVRFARARTHDLHADLLAIDDARRTAIAGNPRTGNAVIAATSRHTCIVHSALSTSNKCVYGYHAYRGEYQRSAREKDPSCAHQPRAFGEGAQVGVDDWLRWPTQPQCGAKAIIAIAFCVSRRNSGRTFQTRARPRG